MLLLHCGARQLRILIAAVARKRICRRACPPRRVWVATGRAKNNLINNKNAQSVFHMFASQTKKRTTKKGAAAHESGRKSRQI